MPWPTLLKLSPHFYPGKLIDFGATGSKVKVTRVKCAKTVSYQKLGKALTNYPQTWSTDPFWVAEKPYWFWGQRLRSQGSNVLKSFPIKTGERLDLLSSNLVNTFILGSRGTLLILGSKVNVTGVKCAKTVSYKNWRMPWPTILKLGPHIHSW